MKPPEYSVTASSATTAVYCDTQSGLVPIFVQGMPGPRNNQAGPPPRARLAWRARLACRMRTLYDWVSRMEDQVGSTSSCTITGMQLHREWVHPRGT